jgi:multiple sugar transport system substrate-binding protein
VIRTTRTHRLAAVGLATGLALSACGGGGFEEAGANSGAQTSADGKANLKMLIGSSGDAETAAVEAAAKKWADETGNSVTVTVASDINQELAQGFASGSPADVFYMDAGRFPDYAKNGSLYPYADDLEGADDFYAPLRDTFTYDDQFYCAPKDFSTLALQINTDAWKKAGLTDADIPTTWDELSSVAGTLTTDDQVGLALTPGIDRLGAFVVENGGWWLNEDATEATGADPAVVGALEYVQQNFKAGSFAWASQLDTGWGGEAFGTGKTAMTIEGNWIKGAMTNDYPDVDYTTVELPQGSAGKGTLLFTQCWGVAADSPAQAQAVDLVDALTTVDQQLEFADAFGVMPSRESAAPAYEKKFPEDAAFIAGGTYGRGPISAPRMEQVIADLNAKLENLAAADLPSVMESFETNAGSALGQ